MQGQNRATVNESGCGFDSHLRKWNEIFKLMLSNEANWY